MRRKLFISFLIVIIVAVSITGIFSMEFTKNFYLNNLENNLVTNSRFISDTFAKSYSPEISNYDALCRELSSLSNVRVTIIAKDGKVIGESDKDSSTMDNHEERAEVKIARTGKTGRSLRYSDTEKIEMMYVAVPVNDGRLSGTIIRLAVPLTEIQSIQNSYYENIILAIFAGILISSVIAFLLMRSYTGPIKQMTLISAQIAGGRYDRRIDLKSNGEMGQLARTFNDMAEKLQATINDLSQQKDKFEAILRSMQSGVIAVDGSGRVLLINPAAMEMFSIKDDIVGRHILEVIRNVELEEIISAHKDEYREIRLNYPEKTIIRVKAAPIQDRNNGGKEIGIVVVMQDITEVKQLELMRSEFVANVSHELKTPLTSIKGFIETLKDGAVEDKNTREKFLDIIDVEADRLTRLINDILTISELENKKQNIPFEDVCINKAVEEIKDMMIGVARLKSISVEFELEDNMPMVWGNFDKVKQLLINLIDNAIKYTHEGGSVLIKTYHKDDFAYLIVKDTGIGIPKEHIPRLFERFYRVDKGRSRALGGTGLGLAIVKHITVTMNGEVNVESEVGKGTTFTVIIPVVKTRQ